MNVEEFKAHYRNLHDHKLIDLVSNKESLRKEAVEALRTELAYRGLTDELAALEEADREVSHYSQMSLVEIQSMVAERMMLGESFESIRTDLEQHGVDVKELLNEEAEEQEGISEFILDAKNQNFTEQEIKDALKAEYHLNDEEIDDLKGKIKSRGKGQVVLGVFLVIFAICIFVFYMTIQRFSFMAVGLAGVGIGLIVKGRGQKKV
ncbi:MAG: hypothetical protein WBA74_17975 [Cyclobacteriaceae bacterium]